MLAPFITFVELDRTIERLLRDQEELRLRLASIDMQLQELNQSLFKLQAEANILRKTIDQEELEVQTLDAERNRLSLRLEQAQNAREYDSLIHESQQLEKQRQQHDQTLLDLWQDQEKLTQEIQEITQTIALQQTELQKQKKDIEAEHVALSMRLTGYQEESKKLRTEVDQNLLDQYLSMRERIANPVVPFIRGSCSGCFYTFPPTDVVELKRKGLITCKNCHRLVYLPETA